MPTLRSVRESPTFVNHLKEFGDAKFTDELLNGVIWHLAKNAENFPELVDNSNIRLIKTEEYRRQGQIIPALNIWFTILDENTVLLLAATLTSCLDEEFNEDIIDENDIPF